ncbi:MAG: UbiD family decarboxylase, partial [candidate division NC10 bacterium]|nr:UbiD family decarboxylase [candidate division NC10 bacterium]
MRVGPAALLCLAFLLHACAGPTAPVTQADRVARLQAGGLRALQAASYRDAFAAFEEALALSEAIDHLPGQVAGLQGLAAVLLELTQWQDAEPLLARAAALAALLGDRAAAADIRAAQGQARRQAGDRAAAEARLTEARETYTRLGDRTGAARALTALGILRRERGDLAGALAAQEEALRTLAAASAADRATAHLNLGRTLEALGRLDEARAQYEQALALERAISRRRSPCTGGRGRSTSGRGGPTGRWPIWRPSRRSRGGSGGRRRRRRRSGAPPSLPAETAPCQRTGGPEGEGSMALRDLREFIVALEDAGRLRRIRVPVDPILEVAAITDRVSKRGGPALLFEQVKGSAVPLLINAFGSPEQMCLALGVK